MDRGPGYRIGYCTSGMQAHRLEDALRVLADLGYRGVFLTLDVGHLDPFAPAWERRVEAVGRLLQELDLACVVETGARFLLDPWRKHHPTLLSTEGAEVRLGFLFRALQIASRLQAACISTWSGVKDEDLGDEEAWDRLRSGFERLLEASEQLGVDVGFEPEPGMFVETVEGFHLLRDLLGRPRRLKLSLDCGHLIATGEGEPADVLLRERELLACVAFEDMRRGVHEHLPFGEGDLDLPRLVEALAASGFAGVAAVELGRHSHDAVEQARRARETLRPLGVPFAR